MAARPTRGWCTNKSVRRGERTVQLHGQCGRIEPLCGVGFRHRRKPLRDRRVGRPGAGARRIRRGLQGERGRPADGALHVHRRLHRRRGSVRRRDSRRGGQSLRRHQGRRRRHDLQTKPPGQAEGALPMAAGKRGTHQPGIGPDAGRAGQSVRDGLADGPRPGVRRGLQAGYFGELSSAVRVPWPCI